MSLSNPFCFSACWLTWLGFLQDLWREERHFTQLQYVRLSCGQNTPFFQHPFKPIEDVGMKFLSIKIAWFLACTTAKRVSDMHALSISPSFL